MACVHHVYLEDGSLAIALLPTTTITTKTKKPYTYIAWCWFHVIWCAASPRWRWCQCMPWWWSVGWLPRCILLWSTTRAVCIIAPEAHGSRASSLLVRPIECTGQLCAFCNKTETHIIKGGGRERARCAYRVSECMRNYHFYGFLWSRNASHLKSGFGPNALALTICVHNLISFMFGRRSELWSVDAYCKHVHDTKSNE